MFIPEYFSQEEKIEEEENRRKNRRTQNRRRQIEEVEEEINNMAKDNIIEIFTNVIESMFNNVKQIVNFYKK